MRFRIGRSPLADIVIPDGTVSREHAELVIDDGRLLLVDRNSTGGTWRKAGRRWERIERAYVGIEDTVKLGAYVCAVADLVDANRDAALGLARLRGGADQGRTAPPAAPARAVPEGPVERDPLTGEVVRKR